MRIYLTSRMVRSAAIFMALFGTLGGCGGAHKQASSPDESALGSTEGNGSSSASKNTLMLDAGPTSTTTMTLTDGGDLQGAQLVSSSSKVIAVYNDAGTSSSTGEPELGRRREDIQTLVVAHRDKIRQCYDEGWKAHPGIEGDIDVRWVIDPGGNVKDIHVDDSKSTIHDPAVSNCVISYIKEIHFAASAKGFETHTHYPFNFHPHREQRMGTTR